MKRLESLHAFEQIKILADSHRLDLLQRLMAAPATLTQLAQVVGESPAWVRHHIKTLEAAGLVELSEIRTNGIIIEKYYRAKVSAFLIQELVLPRSEKPLLLFSGSHDLAIEQLAASLAPHLEIIAQPIGSLDGLVALRQGLCHAAGAHLLDETGEYNTPIVRRLFPDRPVHLITLAHRTQGWMVAPGNPHSVHTAADLARPGIQFINRNPGSGTRLWLDTQIQRLGIPPTSISGYERIARTHTEAAQLIESGYADVALGLEAAARQHGLDFIPLFAERYDIILPQEQVKLLEPVLDHLQTKAFRRGVEGLRGYDTTHTGEEIPIH
jgi:putative molybdopterin biosynthesis protein